MQGKKILIVDDDANLCRLVKLAYEKAGAEALTAHDGQEALQKFFEHRPDLVVLDIMMPRMDGWQTCRQIRLLAETPIIMLTTLNDERTIIRGLDFGADDFISKPYSIDVLMARSRAVLRRTKSDEPSTLGITYKDEYLEINLNNRQVSVQDEHIKLTSTEYRLLAYLLQNANRVQPYEQILHNVWGWEYRDSTDYVHVYISHLRRKIEADPKEPKYLLNEHGVGYYFSKTNRS